MSYEPYVPVALFYKGASVSVTGTTAETTLQSMTLKAGIVGKNDFLEIITFWSYTNVARVKTLRVKIGVSEYIVPAPTTTATLIRRVIIQCRGSLSSQVAFPAASTTDQGSTTGAMSTFTEDLSVDKTLAITGQPSNAADTIVLEAVIANVWKEPTA